MYTRDTPYELEVKNLRSSLENLQLTHEIYPIQNLGSWELNCQQKARCILQALETYPENIVWIDADAVVEAYPALFDDYDCDLAFFWFPFDKRVRSGTLFLRNVAIVKALVQDWIMLNDSNAEWDQVNLQTVWDAGYKDRIKTNILPAGYCKIFDNIHQQDEAPVITHYQASRRFKKGVN